MLSDSLASSIDISGSTGVTEESPKRVLAVSVVAGEARLAQKTLSVKI